MDAFINTFLIPGEVFMNFVLALFGFTGHEFGPEIYRIGAALASWLIWATVIRHTWNLTLHIFGFRSYGGGQ